jgi:hypothetical protein
MEARESWNCFCCGCFGGGSACWVRLVRAELGAEAGVAVEVMVDLYTVVVGYKVKALSCFRCEVASLMRLGLELPAKVQVGDLT